MASKLTEKALFELGNIGTDPVHPENGRTCLAFSENENIAMQKLEEYAKILIQKAAENNQILSFKFDTFGNAHLTLEGKTKKKIIIISHIDSVPEGGKYDGIVGISGGLAAIESLIEKKAKLQKSVSLIACRAEESSATKQACLGSLLATGAITCDQLKQLEYDNKKPLIEHIRAVIGLTEQQIKEGLDNPSINPDEIDGAIELHIEQSGVLDKLKEPIGLVTGGIGSANRREIYLKAKRKKVKGRLGKKEYHGLANHSGGTPMNGEIINFNNEIQEEFKLRDDALVKAMIDIAKQNDLRLVRIEVPGGSCNTVPGRCIVEFIELEKGDDEVFCISKEVSDAVNNIILGTQSTAEKIANETGSKARATIGDITFEKDSIILHLDQRMLCEKAGNKLISELERLIKRQESPNVKINIVQKSNGKPIKFKGDLKKELADLYKELFNEEPVEMDSMPGHDLSKIVQKKQDGSFVQGAMIFVRSLNNGISHNPKEYSSPEDIDKGIMLLCKIVEHAAVKK